MSNRILGPELAVECDEFCVSCNSPPNPLKYFFILEGHKQPKSKSPFS